MSAETAVSVRQLAGDRFAIRVRGHQLEVDQPLAAGGTDAAPTPTELFVASLASCAAFFAARFLRRHLGAGAEVRAECRYAWSAERPFRVTTVDIDLALPDGLPQAVREGALRAAERCTVRDSIRSGLDVRVGVAAPEAALR